jgi:signal peptidase I
MEPTLHCLRGDGYGCQGAVADLVVARPFRPADARQGAILVFQTPTLATMECGFNGLDVKRLIGLPGQVWEERRGFVYINGKKLNEPYMKSDRRDHRTMGLADIPPRNTYLRLPKHNYLMMGDNRRSSCDSRVYGPVPEKNLRWTVVSIDRGGTIIPVP